MVPLEHLLQLALEKGTTVGEEKKEDEEWNKGKERKERKEGKVNGSSSLRNGSRGSESVTTSSPVLRKVSSSSPGGGRRKSEQSMHTTISEILAHSTSRVRG